jgi:hypothetical protein
MNSKGYHSKAAEIDEIEQLRLEDHMMTLQKESKYYSNDDGTIKKRLIDLYEKVPSTHDSNLECKNGTMLNQLHDAIESYRPVFRDAPPKKKLNYTPFNF